MANNSVVADTFEAIISNIAKAIPNKVRTAVGFGKVTDINKASGTNMLELYGICSDNIPSSAATLIIKALETKYGKIVSELATEIIAKSSNTGEAIDKLKDTLGNKGHLSALNNPVASVVDHAGLSETTIGDLMSKVVFNESTLSGGLKKINEGAGDQLNDSIQASVFNITPLDRSNKDVTVSFGVRVSMMTVESHKLVENFGSVRDRSILFNYIKLRAGVLPFWKGFVANLNEIDKDIKRATSDDLSDRVLNDMNRKGGFLMPQKLSGLSEAKYFIVMLEQTDVDSLKSQYNFDIKKPAALQLLFKQYNILSLVIVDSNKKSMRMFDSDNPLKGTVYNYTKTSEEDMSSVFSALARRN
jgi:hypothetical protein